MTIQEAIAYYKAHGNTIRPMKIFSESYTHEMFKKRRLPPEPLPDGVTPVPFDDVLDDAKLKDIDLHIINSPMFHVTTGAGMDAIKAIIGTWDLRSMTDDEYNGMVKKLNAKIAEGNKVKDVKNVRKYANRWAKAPAEFKLSGKLPVTYNILTGLQTFGFLYEDGDEATADAGNRGEFLPLLMDMIRDRFEIKVDSTTRKFTVVREIVDVSDVFDNGGGGKGKGNRRGNGRKKPNITLDSISGHGYLYCRDMSILWDETTWRKHFAMHLDWVWEKCESERRTFALSCKWWHDGHIQSQMDFVLWRAWGQTSLGPVSVRNKKVSELIDYWRVGTPYLSAIQDADADRARDLGGVPLPLVKDLLAATEECIAALLERRKECVDLQYDAVVDEWDKVMPKWFAYRDGYKRMIEIADEDKCMVKPECLREFDAPITGAFDSGFMGGLVWSCYEYDEWTDRHQHGVCCYHPEYRRGYRLAVTHSICPFCDAMYEYDEKQDGKKMTCDVCGKDVQIHRGMLIPWQSIEDSCVCVMSLDKRHIPVSISEYFCSVDKAGTRCKCGATRKDKRENGRIIIGPWRM